MSEQVTCPRCEGTGKVELTPAEQVEMNRAAAFTQQEALRKGSLNANALNEERAITEAAQALAQGKIAAQVADAGGVPAIDAEADVRILALTLAITGYEVDVSYNTETGGYEAVIPELSVRLTGASVEAVVDSAEQQIAMVAKPGALNANASAGEEGEDGDDEGDEETDDADETDEGEAQEDAAAEEPQGEQAAPAPLAGSVVGSDANSATADNAPAAAAE